jgi:molecular chaperone DnaK
MKHYVGIDLGTTNSAICSFDSESLRLYKSPEQQDVTPSVIFIDKRGNRYVGSRAYNNAARNPDNAATLFKRMMGTSTAIQIPAVNISMSPEDCSAELLRVLFGYLPEEVRNDPDTGTVITVPAAFNQMQKDATMAAASKAGIGKVALMQEPVAAIMSVMRQKKSDGIFLVYDLGGGTLDIAVAENIASRVNLLAHGGIAMCGGRDFDRIVFDNVVKPWLLDHFDMPADFLSRKEFKSLARMATWAAEKAKIELSSKEETVVQLSEIELDAKDLSGNEIYLDVPFNRARFNELAHSKIDESIQAARETIEKAGLKPNDVEHVVFVGGPTHYKPLRDKVAYSLGIIANTDVNPMTAVAEGAGLFAESIDWASMSRGRKIARGAINAGGTLNISFDYIARTPDSKTKIVSKRGGSVISDVEFQIDSLDTGWSSGRAPLKDGGQVELPLSKQGENTFKIFLFDEHGGPLALEANKITISRTAATIDAIPSSSSIGIEVLDQLGGKGILASLVREGESLPKSGKMTLKSGESLKAGDSSALHFHLWEGEIEDPVKDNRYIGTFDITGRDFEGGAISAGAELICEYEVLDSGNIVLEITIPSIGGTFHSGRNFYSRQAGQIDYSNAASLVDEEAKSLRARLDAITEKVNDPKLEEIREKVDRANAIKLDESDPEGAKQAMDDVLEAKRLLAQVRKQHLKAIRQIDLDACIASFKAFVRMHMQPTELSAFENLVRTAQRSIDENRSEFENQIDQLKYRNLQVLWRQDWFVVSRFRWLTEDNSMFADKRAHAKLLEVGQQAINADDMPKLRQIVINLLNIRLRSSSTDSMMSIANVVRG